MYTFQGEQPQLHGDMVREKIYWLQIYYYTQL